MKLTTIIITFSNFLKQIGSEIMKLFLRLNGAKIEKNTFVSFSSRIVSKNLIIGKDSIILERVKIKAKNVTIGKNCIISADVFISGSANISIGDKTYLGKKVRIDLNRDVKIGVDVGLGENSVIWTHGYFPPADEGYPITYAPVTIKDKAWVSTNIIILPGITIGKSAIIGAGSVVTKSIEDLKVVAGNPAKVIKTVEDVLIKKDFITILSEIIENFNQENFINKETQLNCSIFNFKEYQIVISENTIPYELISKQKLTILLTKNNQKQQITSKNNFYIFEFNSKEILRTSNKFVNELKEFLVGYGIRFLYKD